MQVESLELSSAPQGSNYQPPVTVTESVVGGCSGHTTVDRAQETLTSSGFLKVMKPDEYKIGGSGDMTDLKAEKPMKAQKLQSSPSIGQPTSSSTSGVWSTTGSDNDFFLDKGVSTALGIGDGDKASFPLLSGSASHHESEKQSMERLSKRGGGRAEFHDDDNLSVSVSQAGKKYIITKRNLIVNYLPQTFSDRQLFNLFVSYGPIDSVKIMRDATTGYSYGFGFVNFVSEEDGIRARSEMNGTQVENKRIKVSFARPPSDDIKDTNLYVTNLPRSMSEEDLFALFAPFGEIVQKKLLVDRYTNLPRGVAFIRFERRDQAAAAINALNNFIPQGADEPIRIRLAEDHGKQKAAYLAGFRAGMGLPNAPPGGHTKPANPRPTNSWQYSGKRSMDAWNYEKRNRGPLCNNSIMEGYWTTTDSMPTSVHATPYVFPGGGMAAEQHPFLSTDWGFATPVAYAVRAEEAPSYAWRSSFLYPY